MLRVIQCKVWALMEIDPQAYHTVIRDIKSLFFKKANKLI